MRLSASPSPRHSPRVKVVLPLPRSPTRAITSPPRKSPPSRAARSSVRCGLEERASNRTAELMRRLANVATGSAPARGRARALGGPVLPVEHGAVAPEVLEVVVLAAFAQEEVND